MTMKRQVLVWSILTMMSMSCGSEHGLEDKPEGLLTDADADADTDADADADSDSDADTDLDCGNCVLCQEWVTEIGILFDTNNIENCYWDNQNANDWDDDTPNAVTACPPGTDVLPTVNGDQCWVKAGEYTVPVTNSCLCEVDPVVGPGSVWEDPSGCCVWAPNEIDGTTAINLVNNLETAIQNSCNQGWVQTASWNWLHGEVVNSVWTADVQASSELGDECCLDEECDTTLTSASYMLSADPAQSWVSLVAGTVSFMTPLRGSAFLETTPTDRVTLAAFRADDTTLGYTAFNDWVFYFLNAVDVSSSSGPFTMVAADANAAPIIGQGTVSSVDHQFDLTLTNNAAGSINLSTGVWTLNYTDATSLGSVTVHLQGTVIDL